MLSFFPAGIERWPIEKWENGHENFKHRFQKNSSYKLTLPSTLNGSAEQYKATTANFQWLIRNAIENNHQLRAMGNGWSFSKVAVCEGGAVDTKALRACFNLKDSFVHPDYLVNNKSENLFFTQCGMSILQLNELLEEKGQSLKASGASNGQTIAGATATGTHGSAFNVGAVHDTIVGIHLINGADRHVWLERNSNKVASDSFIDWLGAERISDDEIFNDTLVSFGNFGFIHGILLETEPIFLLEEYRSGETAFDTAMMNAMNNLDFDGIASRLPFPAGTPGKELYHFEIVINLQDFEPGNPEKGVYLKTLYKTPYRTDYPKRQRDDKGFTYGDNTLGVIQTIIDTVPSVISNLAINKLVNLLIPLAFKPTDVQFGTIGETFNNTKFRGKAASAAIAINSADASKVVEQIVDINNSNPFPGALALRYVKGTKATLGFTRFPSTCVLEMDGVDSGRSREFFDKVWQRLEDLDIPFTEHWGKINYNLNKKLVKKMYGQNAISQWMATRNKLLDAATKKVFTNEFLVNIGLDG